MAKVPANMLGLSNLAGTPYTYGESEQGSLNEYSDVSFGKFNEDGSFIGQYNTAVPTGRTGIVNPAMAPDTPDSRGWRQY